MRCGFSARVSIRTWPRDEVDRRLKEGSDTWEEESTLTAGERKEVCNQTCSGANSTDRPRILRPKPHNSLERR